MHVCSSFNAVINGVKMFLTKVGFTSLRIQHVKRSKTLVRCDIIFSSILLSATLEPAVTVHL